MTKQTLELMEAARTLRIAIEDECFSRIGVAAVAADEIGREFAALNAKINRYCDAARNEAVR